MYLTNKACYHIARACWNQVALPTQYRMVLVTDATAPSEDTNTFSELTEIATGNGYSAGGLLLTANTTDFPNVAEDDTLNCGKIESKTLSWTASGGPIPSSGNGARYLVMLDNNATPANREVWAWWDLGGDKSVADGAAFTIGDTSNPLEIRIGKLL